MSYARPLGDPSWPAIAEPFLQALRKKPHSIDELIKLGRQGRIGGDSTRQALAWLSVNGFASWKNGIWYAKTR